METNAVFDCTKRYRYSLTRKWNDVKKKAVFILVNPSIADETGSDPTTDRCISFAQTFGCGSLELVNLFALVSTNPTELKKYTKEEAIGTENEKYIIRAINSADIIIAAWGNNGQIHGRHKEMMTFLNQYKVYSLGEVSQKGCPKHPLYLHGKTKLTDFINPKEEVQKLIRTASNKNINKSFRSDADMWCEICHEEFRLDKVKICSKCVDMLYEKNKVK